MNFNGVGTGPVAGANHGLPYAGQINLPPTRRFVRVPLSNFQLDQSQCPTAPLYAPAAPQPQAQVVPVAPVAAAPVPKVNPSLGYGVLDPRSVMNAYPRFEVHGFLGRGSYGTVHKAYDRTLRKEVAVKEVFGDYHCKTPADSAHYKATLREISVLRALSLHENIVKLFDVVNEGPNYTTLLVMEMMDTDLRKYLELYNRGIPMATRYVRTLGFQLFQGIAYIHSKGIIHRDLKPGNLLVSPRTGVLKIADFGLARSISIPNRTLSMDVVSLWYRAPELFLKVDKYGAEIDIWSAGCIMAEMLTGYPTFPGPNHDWKVQLSLIFHLMGSPSEYEWPGVQRLLMKSGIRTVVYSPGYFEQKFPCLLMDYASYRLVTQLLYLNPSKRISSLEALDDPFFYPSTPIFAYVLPPTPSSSSASSASSATSTDSAFEGGSTTASITTDTE